MFDCFFLFVLTNHPAPKRLAGPKRLADSALSQMLWLALFSAKCFGSAKSFGFDLYMRACMSMSLSILLDDDGVALARTAVTMHYMFRFATLNKKIQHRDKTGTW